jgi:hypothetical protein
VVIGDLRPYAACLAAAFVSGMPWRAVSGLWDLEAAGDDVLVTALAPVPPAPGYLWQPRVSPKVGLGVPLARIPSLLVAIAEEVPAAEGPTPWSAPGVDHTEGFAYVLGPVGALEQFTGYRPLPRFVVTRNDLFRLGQRLAVVPAQRR